MEHLGKIGLSLCGGGARGILQAGMIKAWLDLGLKYDMLFGVSVGALNGCMLHQGDADQLEKLWLEIRNKDVYTWKPWDAYRPFVRKSCVYNSAPLEKTLRKHVKFEQLKSVPVQFQINATDLSTWSNLSLTPEDFVDEEEFILFLRASASPPILFQYQNFRGSMLCDGGLISNFNLHSAVQAGCDTIILLSPTNVVHDPTIGNIFEMLSEVVSVPSYAFLNRELEGVDQINSAIDKAGDDLQKLRVILIRPPHPMNLPLMDFNYHKSDRKSLIQMGYDIAKPILQRELLG